MTRYAAALLSCDNSVKFYRPGSSLQLDSGRDPGCRSWGFRGNFPWRSFWKSLFRPLQRRGRQRPQPRSAAVGAQVATATGPGAAAICAFLYQVYTTLRAVQKWISKHQVVNEELILCSRWFLLNQTAEGYLIKNHNFHLRAKAGSLLLVRNVGITVSLYALMPIYSCSFINELVQNLVYLRNNYSSDSDMWSFKEITVLQLYSKSE